MNKFWIRITNRHDLVYKYAMILITVVLIVIALPKHTQFNYAYRVGKPWVYESLLAPFDFAIAKSESELNEERAAVLHNMHPFYKFVNGIAAQRISAFKNEFDAVLRQQNATSKAGSRENEKRKPEQKALEEKGV